MAIPKYASFRTKRQTPTDEKTYLNEADRNNLALSERYGFMRVTNPDDGIIYKLVPKTGILPTDRDFVNNWEFVVDSAQLQPIDENVFQINNVAKFVTFIDTYQGDRVISSDNSVYDWINTEYILKYDVSTLDIGSLSILNDGSIYTLQPDRTWLLSANPSDISTLSKVYNYLKFGQNPNDFKGSFSEFNAYRRASRLIPLTWPNTGATVDVREWIEDQGSGDYFSFNPNGAPPPVVEGTDKGCYYLAQYSNNTDYIIITANPTVDNSVWRCIFDTAWLQGEWVNINQPTAQDIAPEASSWLDPVYDFRDIMIAGVQIYEDDPIINNLQIENTYLRYINTNVNLYTNNTYRLVYAIDNTTGLDEYYAIMDIECKSDNGNIPNGLAVIVQNSEI